MCTSNTERLAPLSIQLAALLEAEKEVNAQLEEFLRRKKLELEQSTQLFYRKKSYEPVAKAASELKDKVVEQRNKLDAVKQEYEALEKEITEKKSGFTLKKAHQRMRLEALRQQMEELEKGLNPHLRALKKQEQLRSTAASR